MTTNLQRAHLHRVAEYLLEHEAAVHYAEIRPMRTVHLTESELYGRLEHGGSITMDCSEAVTCLCKWAGLHDPNGLGYSGAGYTGTLLTHLPHYSDPSRAKVGALVVFGPSPGDHAAMVLQPDGANPWLWSHGAENGPRRVRLENEAAVHRRPVTFLSIAGL